MSFQTLKDFEFSDIPVLVRVDYNVPLQNGKITNDKRIKATLKTIKFLLKRNCQIILMSHLGNPQKKGKKGLSLKPVAKRLSKLLKEEVAMLDDCIDIKIPAKKVILLENLRFHKGEESNDAKFAEKLASLAMAYVNDGFAVCHREHASVSAIAQFIPSFAGLLVEKEVKMLSKLDKPEMPFVAIIGGAKQDKINAMRKILEKNGSILVGGVLADTFLKANSISIGKSKYDESSLDVAKELLQSYKKNIILQIDSVVAEKMDEKAETKIFDVNNIPEKGMSLDIGPETIKLFKEKLAGAKTIFWAGPVGVFELKNFSNGTKELAEFIAGLDCTRIIGGGDSAAAIEKFDLENKMTHVSTGGGAALNFIAGKELPGLKALKKS